MDLFALLTKGKLLLAAFKSGDFRTAADLAGDLLKLFAPLLPSGTPTLAVPTGPDLQPLTMPGGFDLGKLIELIQLLKTLFGK